MRILVDGKVLDEQSFSWPLDHTLLHSAYGCFETLLVNNKKIYYLNEHLNRAFATLVQPLGMLTQTDDHQTRQNGIAEELTGFVQSNASSDERYRLKILFFSSLDNSGATDFSYLASLTPSPQQKPTDCRLGLFYDRQNWFADGLCEHKLLNYWPNRIIRQQAQQQGNWDAIRIAKDGRLLETSCANIFLLMDNKWVTPPACGILPGIMRDQLLMNYGKEKTVEKDIFLKDLPSCRGAFVTNSLVGTQAVYQIGDHRFTTENIDLPTLTLD